jgi:hypothetical protein
MKRKMTVLLLVGLLLLVLSASTVAVADSGDLPHDGLCVAYCARAWGDRDRDGKRENCLQETNCHKDPVTTCGEISDDHPTSMCWDGTVAPDPDRPNWKPNCLVHHGPGRGDPGNWENH